MGAILRLGLWASPALAAGRPLPPARPHADPALQGRVERKLKAARLHLMIERPFYGSLALRLPVIPGYCQRAATDARATYYNPEWIDTLSVKQVAFVLAHETMHCALNHFLRDVGHKNERRWAHAEDYAINGLLVKDGLEGIDDMLFDPQYDGLSVESIYALLPEQPTRSNFDEHLYRNRHRRSRPRRADGDRAASPHEDRSPDDRRDGDQRPADAEDDGEDSAPARPGRSGHGQRGRPSTDRGAGAGQRRAGRDRPDSSQDGDEPTPGDRDNGDSATPEAGDAATGDLDQAFPEPLTPGERQALAAQWREGIASAAGDAKRQGRLPAHLQRMVDELLAPRIPWQVVLRRYMRGVQRDDYSFARGSRRPGSAILPRLHSPGIEVLVFVDTSGSISAADLQRFLSEVNAIKSQTRARVTLHAADAALDQGGPWIYEPWEPCELTMIKFSGGGGTSFVPAFEWASQQHRRPDLVIYLTDADGKFPDHAPPYPVLWVVKGATSVPWGERAQLDEEGIE